MKNEKEKYEDLIRDSILFSIDRITEETAYKREAYKLIENLYCYLMETNRNDYEAYSCEIMDVATRCIKNYDSEKGEFLHYFNAAWKQEFSHITGKQITEEKLHGIKITDTDKRNVTRFIKLFKQRNNETDINVIYRQIAEIMDMPIEQIIDIAHINDIYVQNENQNNNDEDSYNIFELIEGEHDLNSNIITEAEVEIILNCVEDVFTNLQDRQKPIVSDIMTIRLYDILCELKNTERWEFINNEILTIQFSSQLPTQRDIANQYERNEASVSRTTKEFLKKVKERIRSNSYGTE